MTGGRNDNVDVRCSKLTQQYHQGSTFLELLQKLSILFNTFLVFQDILKINTYHDR